MKMEDLAYLGIFVKYYTLKVTTGAYQKSATS